MTRIHQDRGEVPFIRCYVDQPNDKVLTSGKSTPCILKFGASEKSRWGGVVRRGGNLRAGVPHLGPNYFFQRM